MNKFIYNNKKIYIPEYFKEILLGKYEEIAKLDYDPENETDYKIKFNSIIVELPEDEVDQMAKIDFDFVWSLTNWLVEIKPEIQPDIKHQKIKQLFKIGKNQYYLNLEFDRETSGKQFEDFNTILSNHKNFWCCAAGVLATVFRRVKKVNYDYSQWKGWNKENYIKNVELYDYNSNDIESIAQDLKKLNMEEVRYACFFLSNFINEILKLSLQNFSKNPLLPIINRVKLQKVLNQL